MKRLIVTSLILVGVGGSAVAIHSIPDHSASYTFSRTTQQTSAKSSTVPSDNSNSAPTQNPSAGNTPSTSASTPQASTAAPVSINTNVPASAPDCSRADASEGSLAQQRIAAKNQIDALQVNPAYLALHGQTNFAVGTAGYFLVNEYQNDNEELTSINAQLASLKTENPNCGF